MEVYIDEKRVEGDVAVSGTIEETVRAIQRDLCAPGQMVVGLRCDGKVIEGNAMADTLAQPASSLTRLDVFTGTRGALASDALGQAAQVLDDTAQRCGEVAGMLTAGNSSEAIEVLSQCVSAWQQIHDAVVKTVEMLEIDTEQTVDGEDKIASVMESLRDVLIQIRQALQQNDHVLLADVIQYEFEDVADRWRKTITYIREVADRID